MEQNSSAGSDIRRTLIFAGVGFASLGVLGFLGFIMILLVWSWLSVPTYNPSSEAWLSLCISMLSIAIVCVLVGPFFWWGLIIDARELTRWRGVCAGMLVSLVAYPLILLLIAPFSDVFATANFYDFLGRIAKVVLATFLCFVWVPLLLVGGLAGLLLAVLQKKTRERWKLVP